MTKLKDLDQQKYQKVCKLLITKLTESKKQSNNSASDIGNIVGLVLGEHKDGGNFSLDDFLAGLEHGLSLVDGSHDNPKLPKTTFYTHIK